MKRKNGFAYLVALLAIVMLTACGNSGTPAPEPVPDESAAAQEGYDCTYDADGELLSERYYDGDTLLAEYEYEQSADGERYLAKDTTYYENGYSSVNEYDARGNLIYFANMDEKGTVWNAAEYTYNDAGNWMGVKEYVDGRLAAEQEFYIDTDGSQRRLIEITYNEDGSWVGAEYDLYDNQVIEIHADADDNVELDRRFEHTYDDAGRVLLTKTFDNGVLVEEVEYRVGSDADGEWSMSGKTTVYHADGSKTVSDSDPEATWYSEITYDAAGNVVEELRYEYLTDENGENVGSKGYKNGRLFIETLPTTGPDGEIGMIWIEYDEDGTKTVTEMDENFDTKRITVYDADGSVLSES